VCPWIFVSSPQAITIFVAFSARRSADVRHHGGGYYLVNTSKSSWKTSTPCRGGARSISGVAEPQGADRAAVAGSISISLSLFGAYGVVFRTLGIGEWLIGATLGAVLYTALMRREAPSLSRPGNVVALMAVGAFGDLPRPEIDVVIPGSREDASPGMTGPPKSRQHSQA